MSSPNSSPQKSIMSNAVDFQTFELEGEVKSILWCGNNDEIILLHAADGSIYRSRDRGESWKRLKNLMMKQGNMVADENQEVSFPFRKTKHNLCLDWNCPQNHVESS